ncbi:MAG: hypothetical protein FWH10_01765 [Oscillospiraceae bacterium]|nr:hypothetical protein [Oscillospiraceae bacterium]
MVRSAKKASQSLLKKGFIRVEGAKHTQYIFVYKGKEICGTFMSRNNQDLDDYLLASMQKQLELDSRGDFIKLIDCPMSEEDYTEILKNKNIL